MSLIDDHSGYLTMIMEVNRDIGSKNGFNDILMDEKENAFVQLLCLFSVDLKNVSINQEERTDLFYRYRLDFLVSPIFTSVEFSICSLTGQSGTVSKKE